MKNNFMITTNNNTLNTFGERVAMHIRLVRFGIIVLTLCLYCFCQKNDPKNDSLLKIDGKTITRKNFNSFQEAKNLYPASKGDFFSRPLSDMSFFITIEALYDKASADKSTSQIKSSDDWKLKQMYFPATLYYRSILQGNLGFSDKEIESYYKAHKESYSHMVPRDTAGKDKADSLHKDKTKIVKTDSVKTYKPVEEVKEQITEALFLGKYPAPDSLFHNKTTVNAKDTTKIDTIKVDTAAVKMQWLYSNKRNLADFFLKKFYQEKYKTKMPDSLNQWYGEGKPVTPADMKVILSWIPEEQRGYYANAAGTQELAKWLLKWKLFSEKANKNWSEGGDEIKATLNWALKLNIVFNYVNSELVPSAKKSVTIDTAMCVFACWDDHGHPSVKPDTAALKSTINQYVQRIVEMDINKQIFDLRNKKHIVMLQRDYKDDMDGSPAVLSVHADSLRDTGRTDEAEAAYKTLSTSFAFTPEGIRACVELAKIQTEKQQYAQAIKNYRDYLVLSNDKSKRCNTFFMIGFIYDEYLNRPEDAAVNYRWVLKNTPDCELSDDAEFMSLHLGEAMNSVEELRAEAMRQGKKVDTSSMPESVSTETKLVTKPVTKPVKSK